MNNGSGYIRAEEPVKDSRPLQKLEKPVISQERGLLIRAAEQFQYLAEKARAITKHLPDSDVILIAGWRGRANAYEEVAGYLRRLNDKVQSGDNKSVLAMLDAQDQLPEIIERQFWTLTESAKALREKVEKETREQVYLEQLEAASSECQTTESIEQDTV